MILSVSWKLQEEQEGNKYYYTVGVKESPEYQQQPNSPQTSRKYHETQMIDSENDLESESQTR